MLDCLERGRGIRDHVLILSHCGDAELGQWIRSARAMLLPSFAEGFGLPVVEAMALGTPVIASDLACFREIGCGIPTLLDPIDAISWEKAILSFLDECPERARQLRMLKDYVAPTWDGHFEQIEEWIDELRALPRSFGARSHPRGNADGFQLRPIDVEALKLAADGRKGLQND